MVQWLLNLIVTVQALLKNQNRNPQPPLWAAAAKSPLLP